MSGTSPHPGRLTSCVIGCRAKEVLEPGGVLDVG